MGGLRWTHCRHAPRALRRLARRPPSPARAVGQYRAPRLSSARARQRRRGGRGAVAAERTGGRAGSHIPVLDGHGRSLRSGWRATPHTGGYRPAGGVQRDRAARLARADPGRRRPSLPGGDRRRADCVVRLVARLLVLASARAHRERARHDSPPDARRGNHHDRGRHRPRRVGGPVLHRADRRRIRVSLDASEPSEGSSPTRTRCATCPCRSCRSTPTSTR